MHEYKRQKRKRYIYKETIRDEVNERDRFIQREVERETIIQRDKRDYREGERETIENDTLANIQREGKVKERGRKRDHQRVIHKQTEKKHRLIQRERKMH